MKVQNGIHLVESPDGEEYATHLRQISRLLQKYEKRNQCIYPVTSGGLQQYLNKVKAAADIRQRLQQPACYMDILPDAIVLHILSFLTADELCVVQYVSRKWWYLSNDRVLWRNKLTRDIHSWDSFGHDRSQALFTRGGTGKGNVHSKEIYLSCRAPAMISISALLPSSSGTHGQSLRQYLRSFFPRKVPRLAMLGPGLESETSFVTRRLMLDDSKVFSTVRMFPGQPQSGMGAGFTYKMATPGSGDVYFDLTIMHSSSTAPPPHQPGRRLHYSRLFHIDDNDVVELNRPAREFCLSLDGLIYVVDANSSPEELTEASIELYALTQHFWVKPRLPFLILSLSRFEDTPRRNSCLDVLRLLHLNELNGVWHVHNGVANNLAGLPEAFSWIVEHCGAN